MKTTACLALAAVLLLPSTVLAEKLHMLIIDKDVQGTNVRESPAGPIVMTIPALTAQSDDAAIERRAVDVTGQKGDWFSVTCAENKKGWMHRSVLGSCASPTEDGIAHLYAEPRDGSKKLADVPDMTRLALLGVAYRGHSNWAKVSCTVDGRAYTGWIPEQCLFSNPHNSCWK